MKRILIVSVLILLGVGAYAKVVSPNGKLSLVVKDGKPTVCYKNQTLLQMEQMGYEGGGEQLAAINAFLNAKKQPSKRVNDRYEMLAGKRLHCENTANEYRVDIGNKTILVVRMYNDGMVFRYELDGLRNTTVPKEQTAFRIPEGMKRWMQQWTDAYEGFFPLSTTCEVLPVRSFSGVWKSPKGFNCRWGYPMLVEPIAGVYTLISEANIERRQSASCLYNDDEVFRVTPDQNEVKVTGKWHSPWRVFIIGSLADVVQSTLVTDVSEPCKLQDTSWIHPGVVSWVYWAYNHGSNDYDIICKYVDLAVALHLPYVLIDAEWDEMKDGKTVVDAVNYAKSKGVKPMIWYNSSVGWVDGAPTPKYRLNKPEDREKEFAWCEKIGVAGVKIDFFSGDNQMNMDYCIELLECAAKHHLLVNFHGATIPRGWQRTYPNLLSTEGVYGAEWYNNVPTFTKQAASHNAILPFTRNVIGPMDYTPCAFSDSQHPHITSHGHELALTVLFESGLQHLADRPESFLAQPSEVQNFFATLPNVWDETVLLSGDPGREVVMARRNGSRWYVAGINGTDEPLSLPVALPKALRKAMKKADHIEVFSDGQPWNNYTTDKLPQSVDCAPRGGFVIVVSF